MPDVRKSSMPRRVMTASLLLSCAVLLTACGHHPVQQDLTELPPPPIDGAALSPTPAPEVTSTAPTQRTAALLIEDFREALDRCNADKAAVLKMLETPEKPK